MFPFHKIYSSIFKSFDIRSETETIERLQTEGIEKIMIIKRSWIFGLAMVWIPLLILVLSFANIYISYFSYRDDTLKYSLLIGVSFSFLFFIFSVWRYLSNFKIIYAKPSIETDTTRLLKGLDEGDRSFTKFFDQTILNQWILLALIIWSIYFYLTHPKITWDSMIIIDGILLFLQWILLGKYRKRMMDLEMDYNIIIPGKILFVNQSGMLSSSQSIEGEKVKTVTANYPGWLSSFFHYGNIEIMTEGGDEINGVATMYYVPSPNETAELIQTLLNRDERRNESSLREEPQKNTPQIGPKEVTYDVKGVVRDVLR